MGAALFFLCAVKPIRILRKEFLMVFHVFFKLVVFFTFYRYSNSCFDCVVDMAANYRNLIITGYCFGVMKVKTFGRKLLSSYCTFFLAGSWK